VDAVTLNTLPKHVIAINIGDATYWGGVFRAQTCSPFTNYDTVIWTGVGCPASNAEYGCVFGNNDNGAECSQIAAPPPPTPPGYSADLQSSATIPSLQTSVAYVLVGSYSSIPNGGRYGFMFEYSCVLVLFAYSGSA